MLQQDRYFLYFSVKVRRVWSSRSPQDEKWEAGLSPSKKKKNYFLMYFEPTLISALIHAAAMIITGVHDSKVLPFIWILTHGFDYYSLRQPQKIFIKLTISKIFMRSAYLFSRRSEAASCLWCQQSQLWSWSCVWRWPPHNANSEFHATTNISLFAPPCEGLSNGPSHFGHKNVCLGLFGCLRTCQRSMSSLGTYGVATCT
jgi:hypothetical protein